MKRIYSFLLFCFVALSTFASEKINWQTKEFSAGRVSIESGFFDFKQILGAANFSPEFKMPIELIYNSGNTKYGLAGRAWGIGLGRGPRSGLGRGLSWGVKSVGFL